MSPLCIRTNTGGGGFIFKRISTNETVRCDMTEMGKYEWLVRYAARVVYVPVRERDEWVSLQLADPEFHRCWGAGPSFRGGVWGKARDASAVGRQRQAGRRRLLAGLFIGVMFDKRRKLRPWVMRFREKYMGGFETEVAAARAYDRQARAAWGELAETNFTVDGVDRRVRPEPV